MGIFCRNLCEDALAQSEWGLFSFLSIFWELWDGVWLQGNHNSLALSGQLSENQNAPWLLLSLHDCNIQRAATRAAEWEVQIVAETGGKGGISEQ